MFKSFAALAIFATGSSLPVMHDYQPVRGATLSLSQLSIEWDENGFEANMTQDTGFALTLKLSGDNNIILKF